MFVQERVVFDKKVLLRSENIFYALADSKNQFAGTTSQGWRKKGAIAPPILDLRCFMQIVSCFAASRTSPLIIFLFHRLFQLT